MKKSILDKIDDFFEKMESNPFIVVIFIITLFIIPILPFLPTCIWNYFDKWGISVGILTAIFAFRGWYQIKRLRKNEMIPPETIAEDKDIALLFELQKDREDINNLKKWLGESSLKRSMLTTDIFSQVKVIRKEGKSSSEISVDEEIERINSVSEKVNSPFKIKKEKGTNILVVSSEDIKEWESALYHMERLLTDISRLISACGVARIHLFYDGPVALAFPIADTFSNRIDIVLYHWLSSEQGYKEIGSLSR